LTAGLEHACALIQGGIAYCWGYNINARVSEGTTATYATPTLVSGLSDITFITAGYSQTQAVVSGTTVYGWGSEYNCPVNWPLPTFASGLLSAGFASEGGCAWS